MKSILTYQGWANYETWCVYNWTATGDDAAVHWQDRAAELAASIFVSEDVLKYHVGDALQEEFDEGNPLTDAANVWADLMFAALANVDWAAIAERLLDADAADEQEQKGG